MSLEYQIPFVSFLFILILNIVYFSKKKIKLIENKPYYWILICSLIASSIDTVLHIISANCNTTELIKFYPFVRISNKILSSLFVIIFSALLDYILLISYEKYRKERKKRIPIIVLNVISIILLFFLNVEIIEATTARNVVGSTIITGYIIVGILLTITTIINLINFKKQDKRYWALFMILFIIIILYFFTIIFPGIIIYDLVLALMCYIMYFTIENPDVKMVEQLTYAKDVAEKASLAKSDFLSSMSHEIRTPLNAIVGLSENLKTFEKNLPAEAKEDIEDITNASQTLLEIVGNILDFNKIESEKMDIIESFYHPKEEIEKLVKVITTRIGEKPITFQMNMSDCLPNELIGDKVHIKQILNNLLTNAIKYTDEGYIKLNVDYEEGNLKLKVEDTGHGIKEESKSKLFSKFERLDAEINSTIEGTGLGLAITKSLVDLMHGKISVESEYGKGSTFTVTIPQKESISKPTVETMQPAKIIVETENNENKKKILIVDDSNLNLKVAKKVVESLGYVVFTATSGKECMDKIFDGNNYDLILMDIMMPEMDGIETLKKLKEMPDFHLPVIALTADAVSGAEEKYKASGFVEYIPKPINKEEMKEKLARFLA